MKYLGLDLIRGTTVQAADFVGPHLVLQDFQQREFYVNQLKALIQTLGDNLFLLCALKTPEDGEPVLVGFGFAYINTDGQCYVPQCWFDEKNAPHGTSTLLYWQMLNWAEQKGCKAVLGEIKAKGDRRSEAAFRRWGFETISYSVAVKITDEYLAKINQRLTGEIKNYELLTVHPTVEELPESDGQSTEVDD